MDFRETATAESSSSAEETLFDAARDRIDVEFRAFDRQRPEVFRLFREYAESIRSQGWPRYSSDAILHRIRWHHQVEKGERDFKLNDHYTSRYARLLMEIDPSFRGFFELRRLRA